MPNLPDRSLIFNNSITGAAVKPAFEDWYTVQTQMPGAMPSEELVILNGIISPNVASIIVDTEGGGATDELTNISNVVLHDGAEIRLRAKDLGRDVVVKHGTGVNSIRLIGGADKKLSTIYWLSLKNVGNIWEELVITAPITLSTETTAGTARIATQAEVDSGVTVGDEPAFVSVEGLRHSAEVTPPYHNYINNPAFQLWTKGESFSGGNPGSLVHASDTWGKHFVGGSHTVSRIVSNSGNVMRINTVGSSAPNSFARIWAKQEDVRRFTGKKTLVLEIASANNTKIMIQYEQRFGGVETSVRVIDVITEITPGKRLYSFILDLPSVSGKIITTGNCGILLIDTSNVEVVNLGAQSSTIDISFVGLYDGDVVLPIVVPDIAETQLRCGRYIQEYGNLTSAVHVPNVQVISIPLRTPMLSIPTLYSVTFTDAQLANYVPRSNTTIEFNLPINNKFGIISFIVEANL